MKKRALEIQKPVKGEPIKATLFIDDELSFINCNEIREMIIKSMKEFDHLFIQASIAHIDLTGIQLLYAIKRSLKLEGKQLKYSFKMNSELKTLVLRSGFTELFE